MGKNVWHKGPPPSVGWWPASMFKDDEAVRWWDGKQWSADAWPDYSAAAAAARAKIRGPDVSNVEWRHRPESWPKRSRT